MKYYSDLLCFKDDFFEIYINVDYRGVIIFNKSINLLKSKIIMCQGGSIYQDIFTSQLGGFITDSIHDA